MDGDLQHADSAGAGEDAGAPPRRRFFALAGAAAGAIPLAGGLSGGLLRPASPQRASRPFAGAAAQAGPGSGDWEALRRALSTHHLIRPGQRSYPAAKVLYDPRFDGNNPAGIAYCATPGDVSACLGFVRKFRLPVAARCGGHSYAGWSSTTGLIVDVTAMTSFRVTGGSVQVGAGLRLIDMYQRLAAHGLAVPGGSCATVGVAGLTLGGGVGVLSRAFGLASDNLEAVQIVTADGQVRTCTATRSSDLFWACRGGGGGNFGIATSFTFRTRPLSQLVLFFLRWPWSQAARVMSAWQSWAPFQRDALWSNLVLSAGTSGGPLFLQVGGTYLGSLGGCQQLLNRLYAAAGSRPSSGAPFQTSYQNAMMIEAGCGSYSFSQCHLPSQTKDGRLPRVPSYAKSDFFTRKIPAAGIRTLVSQIERARTVAGAPGGTGAIGFDAFGGALNRVSPSATAFVHRNALFDAQYSTSWNAGTGGGGSARQHDWLRSFYASMRPWASGQCYQNYVDPDLANWQQAYYGANFTRLTQVKTKYDPHQVFKFPQSIPPA
jgi:hypothetical protein